MIRIILRLVEIAIKHIFRSHVGKPVEYDMNHSVEEIVELVSLLLFALMLDYAFQMNSY